MKRTSKALSVLLVLSLILLAVGSGLFYLHLKNKAYGENMEVSANELKEQLEVKNKELEELQLAFDEKEKLKDEKLKEFKEKFGYEFEKGSGEALQPEIERIEGDNLLIKEEAKALITRYKKYFAGDYFQKVNITKEISNLDAMSEGFLSDKIRTNLYEKIGIGNSMDKFMTQGTIGYLIKNNSKEDYETIKLMAISILQYGRSLNEIGADLSDVSNNLGDLYFDSENLLNTYKMASDYGINLGDLSIDNLKSFRDSLSELSKNYEKNQSILELLKGAGNEE